MSYIIGSSKIQSSDKLIQRTSITQHVLQTTSRHVKSKKKECVLLVYYKTINYWNGTMVNTKPIEIQKSM